MKAWKILLFTVLAPYRPHARRLRPGAPGEGTVSRSGPGGPAARRGVRLVPRPLRLRRPDARSLAHLRLSGAERRSPAQDEARASVPRLRLDRSGGDQRPQGQGLRVPFARGPFRPGHLHVERDRARHPLLFRLEGRGRPRPRLSHRAPGRARVRRASRSPRSTPITPAFPKWPGSSRWTAWSSITTATACPTTRSRRTSYLRTKTAAVDLAFVFPVIEAGEKYAIQERDFFRKFRVRTAFPMHAKAGDAMYLDFQRVFQAEFPGLVIHVPTAMGQRFVYKP